MSPSLPVPGSPEDWLRHARSDLALAQQVAPGILFEALCFHAQQVAEKSIKAVLLQKGIVFPYTHDLARLITLLKSAEIPWPEDLNEAAGLTDYAVETRYPGLYREISDEEYHKAIETAERVLIWAESIVKGEEQR